MMSTRQALTPAQDPPRTRSPARQTLNPSSLSIASRRGLVGSPETQISNSATQSKRKKQKKARAKIQPVSTPSAVTPAGEEDNEDLDFGEILSSKGAEERNKSKLGGGSTETRAREGNKRNRKGLVPVSAAGATNVSILESSLASDDGAAGPRIHASPGNSSLSVHTHATETSSSETFRESDHTALNSQPSLTNVTPNRVLSDAGFRSPPPLSNVNTSTRSSRLQPRSPLLSPNQDEDDEYGAFGFGLVDTPDTFSASRGDGRAATGESKGTEKYSRDGKKTRRILPQEGGSKAGAPSSKTKKKIVPVSTSPIPLRSRCLSSDSYISDDDSSQSDEFPYHKGGLFGEGIHKDDDDRRHNTTAPVKEAERPKKEGLQSPLTQSNIAIHNKAQERGARSTKRDSSEVHVIPGKSSKQRTSSEDDGSLGSDSTFTPSDGESSYFSERRASMENQNRHYHHHHRQTFSPQPPPHAQRGGQQPVSQPYYYPMQYQPPGAYPQMQQQPQQPPPGYVGDPLSPPQAPSSSMYHTQNRAPGGALLSARPPSLRMRSNSAPLPPSAGKAVRNPIEMKLSLSASEEDEETGDPLHNNQVDTGGLDLFISPRGRLSCASSLVESASSEDEGDQISSNSSEGGSFPRQRDFRSYKAMIHHKIGSDHDERMTTTPFSNCSASTDDAGVVNELSAYSSANVATSERGDRMGAKAPTPSGRLTPLGSQYTRSSVPQNDNLEKDFDAPTPTHAGGARNFYANQQSAMMAAKSASAAQPQVYPGSTFLSQLREDWGNVSGGSVVGDSGSVGSSIMHNSPGGAFDEHPGRSQHGRHHRTRSQSRQYKQHQLETSETSLQTTQNDNLQMQPSWGSDSRVGGPPSLAYSDEDDHEGMKGSAKVIPSKGRLAISNRRKKTGDHIVVIDPPLEEGRPFKIYSSRWIMLLYMSILNLLSDWTCYSIAPIAILAVETFGDEVNPEKLVTVFLIANVVASAIEPAILGRLGLRRTVVFGALLLMIGSIIKSGGAPFMSPSLGEGDGWRIYLGFFMVGLSQPLYQCTPALLSASWFPENERAMATGVALNSNQLGVGFAFVFGTLLVSTSDDIAPYFQFLSFISTVVFVGTAMQFDDAPPTPPSDTARVIRGTFEMKIPNFPGMFFVRGEYDENNGRAPSDARTKSNKSSSHKNRAHHKTRSGSSKGSANESKRHRPSQDSRRPRTRSSSSTKEDSKKKKTRRKKSGNLKSDKTPILPSPAHDGPTKLAMESIEADEDLIKLYALAQAPSPMVLGPVGKNTADDSSQSENRVSGSVKTYGSTDTSLMGRRYVETPSPSASPLNRNDDDSETATNAPLSNLHYCSTPQSFDQRYVQSTGGVFYQPRFGYYNISQQINPISRLPLEHDGVEPIITQTPHHLDIEVRDSQLCLSLKACFSRKGFSHCVVAFAASSMIINTLSTFMQYLVRLQGAPQNYVGIIGGAFQLLTMIVSIIFGSCLDGSRKHHCVALTMSVLGALALLGCSVELDGYLGGDLRLPLLAVAVSVGPLLPLSTELGVEAAYPLSENTVLVIQQLFSNLLSAGSIPLFKMLRNTASLTKIEELGDFPEFTLSFYFLAVVLILASIFFATFSGPYLRREEEKRKKQKKGSKPIQAEIENDEEAGTFSKTFVGSDEYAQPYHSVTHQPWIPPARTPNDENFPYLVPRLSVPS